MEDWKEKLKKLAEEQGIEVEESSEPSTSDSKKEFGRKPDKETRKLKSSRDSQLKQPATAPYNFVPLNKEVVQAEGAAEAEKKKSCAGFAIYDTEHCKTGYIDCEIEALTPLYIRDSLTSDEYKAGGFSSAFFSPADKIRLPGSSLRGMVRNLMEIVSFGKFIHTNNVKLYYRAFTDVAKNLEEAYRKNMVEEMRSDGAYAMKVKAGYLTYSQGEYKIYPAVELEVEEKNSKNISLLQYFKVEEEDLQKKVSELYPEKVSKDDDDGKTGKRKKVQNRKFKYGFQPILFQHSKVGSDWPHSVPLWYSKVTNIQKFDKEHEKAIPADWHEGTLVYTGFAPRKHMQWVIAKRSDNFIPVSIEDYQHDVNRHEQYDLLEKLKKYQYVPCFYATDANGQILSFGHTGMFRVNYRHSIPDCISTDLKQPEKIDLAENIFGIVNEKKEQNIAGRVFFEDAIPFDENKTQMLDESVPEILASPKPTTFQHYLEQDSDDPASLHTYDSDDALIRGYKIYWHRDRGDNWKANQVIVDKKILDAVEEQKGVKVPEKHEDNRPPFGKRKIINFLKIPKDIRSAICEAIKQDEKRQYTVIRPVPTKAKFKSRIRFENLTEMELGALLFVLLLRPGCCHKLGMGKPLGLGSVKIAPKLYLSNRKNRYQTLLAEWRDDDLQPEDSLTKFINKFCDHVLQRIDKSEMPENCADLWQTYRLQKLEKMLTWQNPFPPNWEKRTAYMMDPREFKKRKVLPKPEDV